MLKHLKAGTKRRVGRTLSRETLEKLTEYTIAETEPSVSLREAKQIVPTGTGWEAEIERGRETLWQQTFAAIPKPMLLLEFGVWKGDSTRYLTGLDSNPDSRFYGFDSFEGLPEDWRGMAAERFDVGGNLPKIDDARVKFVKGWFRDSLPPVMDELEDLAKTRSVVIHFDADLYSSTLYLLFTLGAKFKRYHFIFDEFSGHETRALFNYIQATGAEAAFHYRLDWEGFPQVVSGELTLP
jgi:hypothetical protein